MRILHVVSYFRPARGYGGTVSSTYGLCEGLTKRGHEVTVYTTDTLDPTHRIEVPLRGRVSELDGIDVYYFKNLSNRLAGEHHLSLPPSLVRAAHDHIREFDIVHLHELRTLVHIPVHHYVRKYNIPYVLEAHGSLGKIMAKPGLTQIYDILWGHKLLRDASKVIALTKMEVEQYKSMGVSEEKIEIVPNGIEPSEFEDLPAKGVFRRKHGLDDDQKMILYLGRIHKIKGLDLLAKTFVRLSKDFNDAKLVFVGTDDGYLPALKNLVKKLGIEGKVLFTGPLYGRDKMEAYVDADVYVLPSIYETFPNTVLEACACGTPVILTDRCGIADMIGGQAGLVVPYDKDALRQAIQLLLSDDQMRLRFGEWGKRMVRERFNWTQIASQVENLYQRVLTRIE